ncbi:hypothetical protein [Amaricoccus sp.]|uniref:hypothetical protein n=1 Tax=Amaricoccus sp. TaxID=1872485 RepID=UPI001B485872|nr:hypothetical protein [Amaricoccus sp.]MBP7003671.1 hypothetical protein [Amaricoccus sp.]
MRARVPALAAVLLVLAGPAAAGAWPRAPGEVFLSFRGEVETSDGGPQTNASVYGEYGLTRRITLIAQFDNADDPWTPRRFGTGVQFALSGPDAVNRYAIGFGVSTPPDVMGAMTSTRGELSLSWGRGFDSRWGGGWATATARLIYGRDTSRPITDLYGLVGLRPAEGRMAMLSASRYADDDGTYWKISPSLGYRLRGETWLVPSLTQELSDDRSTAVGLALWITF